MKAKYRKLLAKARTIAADGCDPAAVYFFEDDAEAAGFGAMAILNVACASPVAPKHRRSRSEDWEEDYTGGRKRRGHRQFGPDRW